VTVQITVKDHDKKKGDTIVLTRRYRLSRNQPHSADMEPLKSCEFYADLGLLLSDSQRWEWYFVSATGHPLSGE